MILLRYQGYWDNNIPHVAVTNLVNNCKFELHEIPVSDVSYSFGMFRQKKVFLISEYALIGRHT